MSDTTIVPIDPLARDEQRPLADHESLGLSNEQLLDGLRGMIRARAVDDRLWLLSRQGKAHFVITSAGHEATQFGCAWATNVGQDYVVPYYRDMALALAMGQTPLDIFLHALGKAGDPSEQGSISCPGIERTGLRSGRRLSDRCVKQPAAFLEFP